ncbi:MAG: PDZ domain-containing protein [Pseudomonadota bacterium]
MKLHELPPCKRHHSATRLPGFALLTLLGVATIPVISMAAEDFYAEQEARRQQEQGRRDMEDRERAQAEALRSQEEAIRHMEATRARIEANTQYIAQQSADQLRQEQDRIDRENWERTRTESLRGQEEAMRRLEVNIQQIAQQSADQARGHISSYIISTPSPALALPPNAPEAQAPSDRADRDDPVSGPRLAPLSERLKTYSGTQSGVLVVSAGAAALFGLQDGDVIISIDGRVPTDDQHAAGILRSYQAGERVKVRVQRDGRVIDLVTTMPGQRGDLGAR